MALYNEVRPHNFSKVVGQEAIVKNISAQSRADMFFNTYIFSGQYGTGKTTMARILAMAVNCEKKDDDGSPCCKCNHCKSILENRAMDVAEIDGASNTGVDKVREIIADVAYEPIHLKKKVYIIDEVHMLSTSAFNALLKTLEEPPETVVFILCTTELRKIPDTVISRSSCYVFERIDRSIIANHLASVCKEKGIGYTEDGLALISRRCDGSMRNALSVVEQVASTGIVNVENISALLNIPDSNVVVHLLSLISTAENEMFLSEYKNISNGMIEDMINVLSDAMLNKMGALDDNGKYVESLAVLSELPTSTLVELSDILIKIKEMLRQGYGKQIIPLEILKFRTRTVSLLSRVEILETELEALKEVLKSGVVSVIQEEDNEKIEKLSEAVEEEECGFDNVSEDVSLNVSEEANQNEPEEELQPSEDFSFGCFDFFVDDMFSMESKTENKTDKKVTLISAVSAPDEEISRASAKDVSFREALKGCVREVNDKGVVVLKTPLEPLYDIIKCCIEVYNIKDVTVELDESVTL